VIPVNLVNIALKNPFVKFIYLKWQWL